MSGQIPGSSLAAEKAIKRGAKPDLMILKKFPGKLGKFDVLEKIGTSYNNFGTFLLQDSDGSKVSAIEKAKQLDCYSICEEIVKKWLKGEGKEPVTYATLVECLRDAKLNVLAGDIEGRLGSGGATASATSSDQPLASPWQQQWMGPPVGHTLPVAPQAMTNWEHQTLSRNSAAIVRAITDNSFTNNLANELNTRGMIGRAVHGQATNYGPKITDDMRAKYLIDAMLSKIEHDPLRYYDFINVLKGDSMCADAESVLALLPTGPSQGSGHSTAKLAATTNMVAAQNPVHASHPPSSSSTGAGATEDTLGTRVTKEALLRLQNLLSPMLPSWDLFAQQIGVFTVAQIKAANAHTGPNWLSTCFNEALEWWVANHHSPTYEVILAVLDPKEGVNPVMNRALAKKVREFMAREQGPSQASRYSTAEPVAMTSTVAAQNPVHPSLPPSSSTTGAGATEDTLEEGDLFEIKCYLTGLEKTPIYNLGLALGLHQGKVKGLMDSPTFLDDVLAAWLRREDGVEKKGMPSWRTLVKALTHRLLGQTRVASDICRDKGIEDNS